MAKSRKESGSQISDDLTAAEAAQILWDEWHCRHELYWNSFFKYVYGVVAISIAPYLFASLFVTLKNTILAFPAFAFLVALFAAFHLALENARLKQIRGKLVSLLGKYNPGQMPKDTLADRIMLWSIGRAVTWAFLFLAFIVETANGYILWKIVNPVIP